MKLNVLNLPVKKQPVLMACVTAIVLSACSTPMPHVPPMNLGNKVQVAESVERLELYGQPGGMSLSARDKQAVNMFLKNYAQSGDGPLYINMPSNRSSGATQTHAMVNGMMRQMGMGSAAVQTGHYQSAPRGPAPVLLSYRRLATVPQDCRYMGDLSSTYNNQAHPGFGCAYSANLAAMISDPRQLLDPYPMTSPDMQRRSVVYEKYIEGENPASQQPARQEVGATDE